MSIFSLKLILGRSISARFLAISIGLRVKLNYYSYQITLFLLENHLSVTYFPFQWFYSRVQHLAIFQNSNIPSKTQFSCLLKYLLEKLERSKNCFRKWRVTTSWKNTYPNGRRGKFHRSIKLIKFYDAHLWSFLLVKLVYPFPETRCVLPSWIRVLLS